MILAIIGAVMTMTGAVWTLRMTRRFEPIDSALNPDCFTTLAGLGLLAFSIWKLAA